MDLSHNRTTSIFATIKEELEENEYITFEDEKTGTLHFISNFGSRKYQCTGYCACLENDEEDERRSLSGQVIFRKGIVYLLVALSSSVALQKASEYFTNECKSRYTSFCESSENIISEVEECSPGLRMVDINDLEVPPDYDEDLYDTPGEDEEVFEEDYDTGKIEDEYFEDEGYKEEFDYDPTRIEEDVDLIEEYEDYEITEEEKEESKEEDQTEEDQTEEETMKKYGMELGDKRYLCEGYCMPTNAYATSMWHGKRRDEMANVIAHYFGCEDIKKSGTCTVRRKKYEEDVVKAINFEYNRGEGPHSSLVDVQGLLDDVMEEEKYAKMIFVKNHMQDFCKSNSWVILKDEDSGGELYERTYCEGSTDYIYWVNESVECQVIFPLNWDDVPNDW